jgi:hypothetical protein
MSAVGAATRLIEKRLRGKTRPCIADQKAGAQKKGGCTWHPPFIFRVAEAAGGS